MKARLPAPLLIAILIFFSLSLVAVVMGLSGGWANWTTLEEAGIGSQWDPSPVLLCGAGGLGVFALLLTARLWASMFATAGGRTRTSEALAAWLGSNLGRYVPGKVWQLTSIAAYLGARGDAGSIALTVSLALQAVMLAVGAVIGLGLLGPALFGGVNPWTLVIAGVAVLCILHPTVLGLITRLARRMLKESQLEQRVDGVSSEIKEGLGAKTLLFAALTAVLIWGLYGAGFWVLVQGLIVESGITLREATGIFTMGYLMGYVVVIAPGGMVVREGAIVGLLGLVSGIPLGPATMIALATRIWTTGAELLAFGLAVAMGVRKSPNRR